MRILEVNGTSLLGATHQEAVNALREAGNEIQIIVCKGYDKSSLIHSIGSNSSNRLGSRASDTGSELSQSVSSLDRDDGGIDDLQSHVAAAVSNFTFYATNWIFSTSESEKDYSAGVADCSGSHSKFIRLRFTCEHILCVHKAHKLHIKLQLDYVRSVCVLFAPFSFCLCEHTRCVRLFSSQFSDK